MKINAQTLDNRTSKRFFELDVFRGIAAFGVLLFHYTCVYNSFGKHSHEMRFYFSSGRHGVELFFMISGFVILLTLEKTKRGLDFIFGRFSRLYPAYWIAIILTFIVVKINQFPIKKQAVTFLDAIFNLTMLQGFFKIPDVDPVYWSLEAELCFYIMMFIIYKFQLLKHIEKVATAWLIMAVILSLKTYTARWGWGLLSEGWGHFHLEAMAQNPSENIPIIMMGVNPTFWDIPDGFSEALKRLLNLRYAHLFIIGIILYRGQQKGFSAYSWILLIACIFAQRVTLSWENSWDTTIIVGIFSLILYLATQNYLKFIVWKPLIFLGTISYPLYLTHQYIGYAIIKNLYEFNLNHYLIILITTLIALTIATLITFFAEQPALHFLRRKYKEIASH